jgi:hypothetical protein
LRLSELRIARFALLLDSLSSELERQIATIFDPGPRLYVHDPNSCIQPSDPDAPLWRVMDLAKFEWLVTKGALYFCRADLFTDRLEGTLPSANRRVPRFFGFRIDPESDKGREFAGHKERIWAQFRRWSYVSCWYRGEVPVN